MQAQNALFSLFTNSYCHGWALDTFLFISVLSVAKETVVIRSDFFKFGPGSSSIAVLRELRALCGDMVS